MFIDYVTLMLINMTGGFVLLALYFLVGLPHERHGPWAPAFGVVGLVALITGVHMTLAWPLPRWANVAFGEMTILLGALFLAAALSLAKGWHLLPVTVYAFVAGVVAIVIGARIINLDLTGTPTLAGIGFILSGLGGVLSVPVVLLRRHAWQRGVAAVVLLAAAGIWAYMGLTAYWDHLAAFSK
jgi:putative membrane protein